MNKHWHWFMVWKIRSWILNYYKVFYQKSNKVDMKKLWWWSSPLQTPFLMLENVSRVSALVQQWNPPAKVPSSSMEILSVTWVYRWEFNINMETVDLFFVSGSCPCFPALSVCSRGLFPWISSLFSVLSRLSWFRGRQAGRPVLCQPSSTCWGTEHPSCQCLSRQKQLFPLPLLTKPLPAAHHCAKHFGNQGLQ